MTRHRILPEVEAEFRFRTVINEATALHRISVPQFRVGAQFVTVLVA